MSYSAAITSLNALGHELYRVPAQKFDLDHMRVLLRGLGDPYRQFKSVLIAGTNGKGSTAATLASIVQCAGHNTGLYTSPHLIRPNERIRLNDTDIPDEAFGRVFEQVEATARSLVDAGKLPWHPSFFETMTAMAFMYFAEQRVDLAVLEVGMGGRLDATNVVDPLVAVITDVALDHQQFLGSTIGEIAREKAGIIRSGGLVVTLPQHPKANDAIGNTILERGAVGVSAVQYVPPVSPGAPEYTRESGEGVRNIYPLEVMGEQIVVNSPLPGRHQLRNLALAIAAAEQLDGLGVKISARDIERGIRETRWPGRLQVVAHSPEVIMDVAHNPAGAWALRSAVVDRYHGRRLVYVFGVMRDKAVDEIAQILFPTADHVVVTQPADHPRAATAAELAEAAAKLGVMAEQAPTVADAVTRARAAAGENGVVVVTGSIYIVGEAAKVLISAQ